MSDCKFTPYGLRVKTKLMELGKNQKWLEKEVCERTGLYVDNGYIYKILTGKRQAPKIVQAINEVLNLEEIK